MKSTDIPNYGHADSVSESPVQLAGNRPGTEPLELGPPREQSGPETPSRAGLDAAGLALSPAERLARYSSLIADSDTGILPPDDLRGYHAALAANGQRLPQEDDVVFGTGVPNPLLFESPPQRTVYLDAANSETGTRPAHPFASFANPKYKETFGAQPYPVYDQRLRNSLREFVTAGKLNEVATHRLTNSHAIGAQLLGLERIGKVVVTAAADKAPSPSLTGTPAAIAAQYGFLPKGLRPGQHAELVIGKDKEGAAVIDRDAAEQPVFSFRTDTGTVKLTEAEIASHLSPVLYLVKY